MLRASSLPRQSADTGGHGVQRGPLAGAGSLVLCHRILTCRQSLKHLRTICFTHSKERAAFEQSFPLEAASCALPGMQLWEKIRERCWADSFVKQRSHQISAMIDRSAQARRVKKAGSSCSNPSGSDRETSESSPMKARCVFSMGLPDASFFACAQLASQVWQTQRRDAR